MEVSFIWLLWTTAIIFSIAAFKWKREYFFPLFAGFFWLATAYSMVQIHYVGYGSTNIIIYDHELGDWYGDVPVFYLLGSIFLMFMLETFSRVVRDFRSTGEHIVAGNESAVKRDVWGGI